MRSFIGLLVLESIFDDIPRDEPDILNLAHSIFTPNLLIVEDDCETTLGKYEDVNYEIQGLTEMATDTPFSKARVEYLLSKGVYRTYVRHTSTCISKGGVCLKCYKGTFPDTSAKVIDRVTVQPEYLVNAEIVAGAMGVQNYSTLTDPTTYTKMYVFKNGVFLHSESDYTFSNGILSLTVAPSVDCDIIIRFLSNSTSAFIIWLASSYSGALLGMSPITSSALPVRPLLLSSLLSENRLQSIEGIVSNISSVPSSYSAYSLSIKDPLERALYLITLYSVYSQAAT